MANLSALQTFCTERNLPLSDRQQKQFRMFLSLLEHFNQSMNLVGPMSRQRMIEELLIDSIRPATAAPPSGRILDIGSGAGLPGIPLHILFPHFETHLVEPRKKRHTFTKIVKTRLDLENLCTHNCRIEDITGLGTADYVISKAFQPPSEWLETAQKWVSAEGQIVCMTTPETKTQKDGKVLRLIESQRYETLNKAPRQIRIYERVSRNDS